MVKAEQSPPFKMRVEKGHLVPAAAWDAERMASYRNGSEVNVVITQEAASWRRRKYWAILGNVVKTCPVRQTRAEDLHKAIRLKLGIVESFTTMGGATKVELRSTSLMDEQEFEAFYHEAMDLLREQTGVDVETLGKEAADVGPDEHESPDAQSPASDEGSGASIPVEGSAPDQSAAADLQAPGETATPSETPGADARAMMEECLRKFIGLATDTNVPDPKERRSVLAGAKDDWKRTLPDHLDFVKACFSTADKVIKGELPAKKAEEYLRGLLP